MGDLGPEEDECAAVADIRSAVVCPWDRHYAWAACDLSWHGEPYPLCSRSILRRTLRDVEARGWTFNLGVEPEFYVLREIDGRYAPLSPTDTLKMPGYDLRSTFDSMLFLSMMVAHLMVLEWGVDFSDLEVSRYQFEFYFSYADPLYFA